MKNEKEVASVVDLSKTPKNSDGSDCDGYFSHPKGHIRDRVILHEGKDSPKEGQFVQLNGFPFQILYNKEIMLPRPIVEMLQKCIFTEINKDEHGVETKRDIPRFNLSILERGVNLKELSPAVEQAESKPVSKKPSLKTAE